MIVLKTKKTEQKATKIGNTTFFGHTSMSCTMFTQPFPLHIFLFQLLYSVTDRTYTCLPQISLQIQ